MSSKGLALILAGGGGKGAYQIGVWKALKEFKVDEKISAVSGTSIGALNGALFSYGRFDIAENIYNNIRSNDILKFDPKRIIDNFIDDFNFFEHYAIQIARMATNGVFSRSSMTNIINQNIDLVQLSRSNVECYATCFNMKKKKQSIFYSIMSIQKKF